MICSSDGNTAPVLSGSAAARSAGMTSSAKHVLVADRVAVALEPEVLAFVGVEVLHPELGRVGMGCIGADRPARRHPHSDRLAGTTTWISARSELASRLASALYVQRIVIGVSPEATVPDSAITGTRLPDSFSWAKKSRPAWASSSEPPLASAAAKTEKIA